MSYRFEKLNVWIKSRDFIKTIYFVTEKFPAKEFSLKDQLKRAVVSIALNIAEGSDKKSDKDFIRFLRISIGSTNEVVTILYIAKDLGFMHEKDFINAYNLSCEIVRMLNALIGKLNANK